LVRAKVELIVTWGTPATIAAKDATTTIPIVFAQAADPVHFGLVASLARPGGNVTGFSAAGAELIAKSLSLLKDLVPKIRHFGVLESSANPYIRTLRERYEQTSHSLGLTPVFVEVGAAAQLEEAIANMARQRVQAVYVGNAALLYENREKIAAAAVRHRLPTIGNASAFVREGGFLVSYATTDAEVLRRRAYFIDRILRGAKPAELPVEQPTRFELVINLKTARSLKLAIPQSILQRADEVIR
jgi:putative ABC transport system substrate-binding protein